MSLIIDIAVMIDAATPLILNNVAMVGAVMPLFVENAVMMDDAMPLAVEHWCDGRCYVALDHVDIRYCSDGLCCV